MGTSPIVIQDNVNLNNTLTVNADGSINISGSIVASNPSVGTTNASAPTSATELGMIDAGGKLQGVSATNPLPISGSFSASFTEPVLNVQGSASSAAVLSNFPVNPTTGYRSVAVQVTAITAGNTLICEESNDGTTWAGIQTVGDTTAQASTPMTSVGKYIFPISALQFRIRQSVFSSGNGAVNAELRQNVVSYAGAAVAIQGTAAVSDATTHTTLTTINTTLGAPMQATGGTVGLVAGSAIVGKIGIDQTAPGTTNGVQVNAALPAGTNLLGKVGIDQTTPGTTNAVQANAGTNLNTSLLALEAGGNLATIAGAVSSNVVQSNTKQVNGVTTLAGAGAVGTGSQRVAVGQDTTTIAGSAPGTAGTPSAQVVSVQGIASMTPMKVDGSGVTQPVSVANDVPCLPATDAFQSGTASATGTSSTSLIPLVTSKSIYITHISLSNTSATATLVSLQDGSGGTTIWTKLVPAGGGHTLGGDLPFCKTSSGNALYFAAGTGVSTLYANAAGFAK